MNKNGVRQRRVGASSIRGAFFALARLLCLAAGAVGCLLQSPSQAQEPQGPRILVGPNVLVSREPNVAHVEPWVAAHPTDPTKLIAMATTVRDMGAWHQAALYTSVDGGQSWTGPIRPHPAQYRGGDPIVGYGRHGTGYAIWLVSGPGGSAMWIYRSEDGGLSWDTGVRTRPADHPRLAVDYNSGKYAGRAYLAAMGREDLSTRTVRARDAYVWRSEDDGRTWLSPVVAGRNPEGAIWVSALQVLSDGTVAVFLLRRRTSGDLVTPTQEILLSTSTDGGVTFNARTIGTLNDGGTADIVRRRAAGRFDADATISFDAAVDTRSTRYGDRMYMLHAQRQVGTIGNRLVLSYSTDRGATWNTSKVVAPETDPEAAQFHSAIAVNRDGTVGVFWYDTRGLVGRDQWHVYFTASLDGGETFLPPVRVSSEPSTPFSAENQRPIPISVAQSPKSVSVSLSSAFGRFPSGGDYVGVTADAAGLFHPCWTDSRTGSFQLYTSRIQVLPEGGSSKTTASSGAKLSPGSQDPPATARAETLLNDRMTLAFDPSRLDWAAGEILLPVRLKNTSMATLYGPFSVEVARLETLWWSSQGVGRDRHATVELLNSSNGLRGKGARIDYGPALRDLPGLEPGAVSEAITWRVRPASLRWNRVLEIEAVITGYVAAKPKNGSVP